MGETAILPGYLRATTVARVLELNEILKAGRGRQPREDGPRGARPPKEERMIPCEERDDVTPVCPHCEAPLERLQCRRVESVFGKRYAYFCDKCRKILGVSHRKGFWMG